MLNHIVVMGRLVKDVELRRTGSGTPVASLTLAVDRDFKDGSGKKETDFIDIVAWRNTAEFVAQYFTKGRMAVVSGRLQLRSWTDKEGGKRRAAEVVADSVYFGDKVNCPAGTRKDGLGHSKRDVEAVEAEPFPGDFSQLEEDEDELPF